jgi:hypothetical protein
LIPTDGPPRPALWRQHKIFPSSREGGGFASKTSQPLFTSGTVMTTATSRFHMDASRRSESLGPACTIALVKDTFSDWTVSKKSCGLSARKIRGPPGSCGHRPWRSEAKQLNPLPGDVCDAAEATTLRCRRTPLGDGCQRSEARTLKGRRPRSRRLLLPDWQFGHLSASRLGRPFLRGARQCRLSFPDEERARESIPGRPSLSRLQANRPSPDRPLQGARILDARRSNLADGRRDPFDRATPDIADAEDARST